MLSPFSDDFIATLRKNIAAVFSMIRKLTTRVDSLEAKLSQQEKRIERMELVIYGLSEELKDGTK